MEIDAHSPPEDVRAAMRLVAAPVAVAIVHDGTEVRGATVTSFMSVTLEPPTLALGVHGSRWMHEPMQVGRAFTLNVLQEGQEHVADHFSGQPARARGVHAVRTVTSPAGLASLAGSLVVWEALVTERHVVSGHSLLVATVTGVTVDDHPAAQPLLWRAGDYAYLERAPGAR